MCHLKLLCCPDDHTQRPTAAHTKQLDLQTNTQLSHPPSRPLPVGWKPYHLARAACKPASKFASHSTLWTTFATILVVSDVSRTLRRVDTDRWDRFLLKTRAAADYKLIPGRELEIGSVVLSKVLLLQFNFNRIDRWSSGGQVKIPSVLTLVGSELTFAYVLTKAWGPIFRALHAFKTTGY